MENAAALKEEQAQGCYFKVEDNWLGVFQSVEGPKLFFNKEVYPLSAARWDAEWVMGRKNHLFIFYWNGEMKISLRIADHREIISEMNGRLQQYSECRAV